MNLKEYFYGYSNTIFKLSVSKIKRKSLTADLLCVCCVATLLDNDYLSINLIVIWVCLRIV